MMTRATGFRMRGWMLAGVALIALSAAKTGAAQTLEEVLATAYENNPQIIAQRALLRSTDENIAIARSGWRPTVTVNNQIGAATTERQGVRGDPRGTVPRSSTLDVSQPLYRGGRTEAGVRRSRNQIQAERARLFAVEQAVFLDASTAYFNLVRDEATLALRINNVSVLTRQLESTTDQFRVGVVTRTDVSQAEAALAGANADRSAAEGNLTSSRATFQRIVGIVPDRLTPPPAPAALPAANSEAASMAATANPSVIAARFDSESAKETIEEIRGELLPTVSLTGQLAYRAGQSVATQNSQNSAQAVVSMSVPLYESGSVYARMRQARQIESQRTAQFELARRQAVEASATAFESLQSTRARIVALKAQIKANEIALEGVRQEATVGSRTVLDVLNAEQTLLNSQVSLVQSQRDELVFSYQLLSAVGRLTAQGLALPVQLYDFEANFKAVENKWFGSELLGE